MGMLIHRHTIKAGVAVETQPTQSYSKADITKMSLADLKKIASEVGIEGKTAKELKGMLIEHFGL